MSKLILTIHRQHKLIQLKLCCINLTQEIKIFLFLLLMHLDAKLLVLICRVGKFLWLIYIKVNY
jgi:hypothetical protein